MTTEISNKIKQPLNRNIHLKQCLYCQLYPCIQVLKMLSIDLFQPCTMHNIEFSSSFRFQQIFTIILVSLVNVFLIIYFLFGVEDVKVLGSGFMFLYGDNINVTTLIFLLFQFYYTTIEIYLYWRSRHKIILLQPADTHQEFPYEMQAFIDQIVILSFIIHFILSFTFTNAIGLNGYELLGDINDILKVLFIASVCIYLIIAWARLVYGIAFSMVILITYILHFQNINKNLQEQERSQLESNLLLTIQRKHLTLCESLQHINNNVGWLFLFTYMAFLGLVCFHLYLFVYAKVSLSMKVHMIFLVAVYLVQFIIMSLVGGEIHSLARNCLYYLWKFDMNGFSLNKRLRVLTLMKKYSWYQVGVRIWNCFAIKRMFIYRGLSSLSSLFSTLQKVHQITEKHFCTSEIQNKTLNNTSYDVL